MALEKIYTPIGWQNKPSTATPLGSHNLSKMDEALDEIDTRLVGLSEDTEELDERVGEAETDITQNAQDITRLNNSFNGFSVAVSQGMEQLNNRLDEAEDKIENNTEDINALKIIPTASGTPAYMDDASNMGLEGIDFYGESKQNGTPTPTSPIPIESKIVNRVDVLGKNELDCSGLSVQTTAGITFTPKYDDNGVLQYANVNGTWDSSNTATNTRYKLGTWYPKTKGNYVLNGMTYLNELSYLCLDKNGDGGAYEVVANTSKEFTVSEDAEYYDVWLRIASGTTVSNLKIYPMIRLATITDSTFEPYKPIQTVNLSAPIELNGIGGVRDYIDVKRGVKVEKVVSKTLTKADIYNFTESASGNYVATIKLSDAKPTGKCMCTHFLGIDTADRIILAHLFRCYMESDGRMYIRDTSDNAVLTDSETAKNFFDSHSVTIYYELAEPIETALPQADIDAIKNLHTYKPNTIVMNDADAEMDVHYVADPRLYIDRKFEALESAIVNQ